jgi:uncharacterized protein (TIGR02147 family)
MRSPFQLISVANSLPHSRSQYNTRMAELYYFNLLQEELRKRQKRNSSFSVRAFAHFLKIDSGTLSAIMKGKRKPTSLQAQMICSKLALNTQETKKFFSSLKTNVGLKKLVRVKPKKLKVFELNGADQQLVLGWEHYAILCLMDTQGFQPAPAWISKRLNVSDEKVRVALSRLETMNLISISGDGSLEKKFTGNFSFSKVSSEQRLISALETVDLITDALKSQEDRSSLFCSLTMPVDPEKLKDVSELVTEFQMKLAALAEGSQPKEVYRLALGLFPLSG